MADDLDDLTGFSEEIRSIMGVYALHGQLDMCFDKEPDLDPPLTHTEGHMMVRLDGPRRMGVLAKLMLALPSTITATADSLEKRGLVVRERDPSDRRAWLLQLTPEGAALREDMLAEGGQLFRQLSGLNDEEIRTFAELASKIHSHILKTGTPEGMR
jgi:DNA-binding MarR family transcriptional regulator